MGIYVGLDVSFTSSGVCIIDNGKITLKNVKTVPKDFKNDLLRLRYIVDSIINLIPSNIDMLCIEDVYVSKFFAGSGLRLMMLAGLLRMALFEKKIPFQIFAPSQSKKFLLGRGVGDKNLILMGCFKEYGITCANDDQADALVGAKMAESIYNYLNKIPSEISKAKSDVIKTIVQERPCYNIDLEKYGIKRKLDKKEKE